MLFHISKIFSPKKMVKILAGLTQNTANGHMQKVNNDIKKPNVSRKFVKIAKKYYWPLGCFKLQV
jgi:hypothetical protein